MNILTTYYSLEEKVEFYLRDPFVLVIRLYWGWLFFRSGFWKFTHYDNAVGFFNSLGLPFPELMVLFIATVEAGGGILLILGLFSRFTSLVLTGNMIGAYLVAHREELFSIISKPDEFYSAPPFTFLFASLVILVFGAGRISVDYLIKKKLLKT